MVKYFDDYPHIPHRAVQIWQILVGKAHNRQTLPYEMLAKLLGYGGAGMLGGHLEPVALYCRQNGLPPLTTLVVEKYSGLPSVDLTDNDPNEDREAVFQRNWYSIYPPTAEDFALAKERGWHYLPTV
jgi:hypothetical protein